MQTLEEYIAFYERKTGEKFERNKKFELFFLPEKGFVEMVAVDGAVFVWQMAGDLKFWFGVSYDMAKKLGLDCVVTHLIRNKPKAYIRCMGFDLVSEEERAGEWQYKGRHKVTGAMLTVTQLGAGKGHYAVRCDVVKEVEE